MIIRNLQQNFDKEIIMISADFVFKSKDQYRIYYQVDSKYQNFIQSDATAFLAAAIVPCMKLKEDIIVEGTVSKKFLKSMKTLMSLVESWNIGLSKVAISVKQQMEDAKSLGKNGLFFSGGVDSFYTYLKLNEENKTKRINHFLFVHGFDIPLVDTKLYGYIEKNILSVASQEKVNVIRVKTNVREMLDKYVLWNYSHGAALASVALVIRRGLANVYFSGAVEPAALYPYGMHPRLDPLWSTEKMKIIHFGHRTLRINKVKFIATSSIARKTLRVCWRNRLGEYNCSRCEKCIRTMVHLYVWGVLKDFKTFRSDIDLNTLSSLHLPKSFIRYFKTALDVLKLDNDDIPLIEALKICIDSNLNISLKTKILLGIRKFINELDIKYTKGKLFYLLSRRGVI